MKGHTALVTGAAGDIGSAVARQLADGGAALVLTDRPGADLEPAADICRARGAASVTTLEIDLTATDDVTATLDRLASTGTIADLVVNNAGYQGDFTNTIDYDLDDLRRVLDINVVGAFAVLQTSARLLRSAGRTGSIVNTASMAKVGAPNMAAYSASKAAVIALTRSAAKDVAEFGIRVNSVSPAFIGPGAMWDRQVELQAATRSRYFADDPATVAEQMIGQVPLGRYGSVDEVAATILFLLSDAASYLTGIDIEVAGGAR